MGMVDEEDTCVDKDFKAVGMQNLRMVDTSVAPFLSCLGLKTHNRERAVHIYKPWLTLLERLRPKRSLLSIFRSLFERLRLSLLRVGHG